MRYYYVRNNIFYLCVGNFNSINLIAVRGEMLIVASFFLILAKLKILSNVRDSSEMRKLEVEALLLIK